MEKWFTIILFLFSINSFGCDCKQKTLSEWQKYELENSDYIFVGEVIEVNDADLTFKVIVTEMLVGGDSIGHIYIGKNWEYCSPYIDKNGKWLVYGNMEGGFLRLTMCGISRSFSNPIVNPIPPPTQLDEMKIADKETEYKSLQAENRKTALSDLELEIAALRKIRDEK